jgi:hypothetical protein
MSLTQKDLIMQNLGLTSEEADQLLADDKAIDKGEKMPFDLTAEQQKVAKTFTVSTTKTKKAPTVYKFERKKTENVPKAEIIAKIEQLLTENGYENVKILNKERQIAFTNGENDFEITLTQKRKPKN